MGIISVEKSDHLFWLGRYVERVFTTLNTFFTYYDRMLDTEKEAYKHFCERLSIPDIYENQEDFVQKYLFPRKMEIPYILVWSAPMTMRWYCGMN